MPLTTTEVPTYFGPTDSPLFGVLHLPADNQIRGGVLICGSLGKEGMDSVRLQRILADGLADRGFAVLRFDYLGVGDSAYAQLRDDAVKNWLASVCHALDYLKTIGAESATAIGIRAGCLILDRYLAQSQSHAPSRPIDRLIYLDPAGTGRRYLREHTTLFRLAVGEDAGTPGEVSVIGGRFTEATAAEFSALKLGTSPLTSYGLDSVFVVGRPAETETRLNDLTSAEGVDSTTASGLPECAQPSDTLVPVPLPAVDAIIEWVHAAAPTATQPAVPQYQRTATMPAQGPHGVDVDESIENIGPTNLFAIRTTPRSGSESPVKTVVFFVTANDSHVGPAREWVEMSRHLATAGAQALRWDPTGLGFSGKITRERWRKIYSKTDIVDSIAVTEHATKDAATLQLVGICSGAWYAAHAARKVGSQSAVLINLQAWNWLVSSTLVSEWNGRKRTLHAIAAANVPEAAFTESGLKRLGALIKPLREYLKTFMHEHFPRRALLILSRLGLVYLPEELLTKLADRGTEVTLIVSPPDAEAFAAKGGPPALDRLRRKPRPPRFIASDTGDHAAHHPAILAAIRREVLPPSAETSAENDQLPAVRPTEIRRIP